jgi:hypothetical protein
VQRARRFDVDLMVQSGDDEVWHMKGNNGHMKGSLLYARKPDMKGVSESAAESSEMRAVG